MCRPKGVLLLAAIGVAVGCGSSGTAPTPTPTPQAQPVLVNFTDTATSVSTKDVRESQRRIVNFDSTTSSLIWTLSGQKFTGYPVSGNFIGVDRKFQVIFGTEAGERRAYFTEAATSTICVIEVVNGQLVISGTSEKVPGS